MSGPLATAWIALAFIFAAGVVSFLLSGNVNLASDVLPAWLQAFGGLAALGVSIFIALHERRVALNAKAQFEQSRLDRAEEEASRKREIATAAAMLGANALNVTRKVIADMPNIDTEVKAVAVHQQWVTLVNDQAEALR